MATLRLICAIMLFPLSALADDSCYSNYPVIDRVMEWDFSQDQKADFVLPSWNRETPPFYTHAAAHFELRGQELKTNFDFKTSLLSLPYNVFRVDITVGEEGDDGYFQSARDLTDSCRGTGPSFYPGGKLELFPVAIPAPSSGGARGIQKVRIRVWGILR